MKTCRVVCVFLMLVVATGCSRRSHASLPNMAVPVGCASEILLIECDTNADPPKCKGARVKYRKGCEEIVARK
jgi:hypothetical protein